MSGHVGQGLAATRLSVQTLNRHVVQTLLAYGIPAVGISPCFGGLHGETWDYLDRIIRDTIAAGLVPVMHGDACVSPDDQRAFILGGDALMEHFGTLEWISRAIFITDVDGIFTADPRHDESAELVPRIEIDAHGQLLQSTVTIKATGSSHSHDVTGGLEAKLDAAIKIAKSGTEGVIVKCGSKSAEAVLSGSSDYEFGTVVKLTA
jgi:isopentenyl phosphate kinase